MPTTFATYIGTGSGFDTLTRWASRRNGDLPKCSHIELLDTPFPTSSAWCLSASKRDGFKVRETYIKFKPDHWRFWTFDGMDNALAWRCASAFLGQPYDLWGAVLSVTPFAHSGSAKIFCSELMGIVCHMPNAHAMTPSDWEHEAIQRGAKMTTLPQADNSHLRTETRP